MPFPRLDLTITASAAAAHVAFLQRHLLAAHRWLRPPLLELSLVLVGDTRMADLHQRFLNLPGPTDVLTFPLDEDEDGRVVSGEIVVCAAEARRRAGSRGDVRKELLLYAVHGLLHLCGFDDKTDVGFAAMHRTEDEILMDLGVGAVFASDGSPATHRTRGTPRAAAQAAAHSIAIRGRSSAALRATPSQHGAV